MIGSAPQPTRSDRLPFPAGPATLRWILVLAVGAYAIAFLGHRPLWEPDEGRYTAVAIQMERSGDALVPHLHPNQPHYAKPPLTYWAIAGAFAVLGRSELAARLPGALAFAGTALLAGATARRLGLRRPTLAVVVYATSLLPFVAANVVTTDSILTLWETAAAWAFLGWWRPTAGGRGSRRWLVAMWAAFGLAFLTKGPVGLLPLAAFAVAVGRIHGRSEVSRMFPPAGLLLFAASGLGWFAAVVARDPELLGYFLRHELVDRVASDVHGRDGHWYGWIEVYLPVLLLGPLPWSALLLRRRCRADLVTRLGRWRSWPRCAPRTLFLALWLGIPVLVFAVVRSRMPLYLVPSMVPLAIALTAVLGGRWRWSRTSVALVAAWAACLLGLRILGGAVDTDRDARALADAVRSGIGGPVEEVVFVDESFGHGLSFYLDADVEHVGMASEGPPCQQCWNARRIEQALADDAAHRAWLVPAFVQSRFEETVHRAGFAFRLVGRHGKLGIYGVTSRPAPAPKSAIDQSDPAPAPGAQPTGRTAEAPPD